MGKCLIVNFHTKHINDIERMISNHFDVVEVVDGFSSFKTNGADFIILTGGAHIPDLFYQEDEYKTILNFIRNTNIPLLGICFGCELIAVAYGCTLVDIGHKQIFIQNICFKDKNFCLNVSEAHRFSINAVSKEIEVLSRGDNNSIEMLKCRDKNIIGVQFHPELNEESAEFFEYVLEEMKS